MNHKWTNWTLFGGEYEKKQINYKGGNRGGNSATNWTFVTTKIWILYIG